ncbi:MAG: hypothetical protein JW874_12980 [Spirochaetales bacterium]|nr:hypothetical protein [Spirochaetales bacterium]
MDNNTVFPFVAAGFFVFAAVCCSQQDPDPDPEIPKPEILIMQGENEIADGTIGWDFGSLGADGYHYYLEYIYGPEIPFTIENVGTEDLEIYNISISAVNGDNFILYKSTPATVLPGETASFSMIFDPASAGLITEEVDIESNDPDYPNYTFTATGKGIPVIDIMTNSNIYCFDDVAIAVDGPTVYAVYCVYFSSNSSDLCFARSDDSGISWDSPENKVIDGNGGRYVSMAIQSGTLYVSYFDETHDDLKFAKSSNGGTDWSTITVETDTGEYNDIAIDGDNVYISYYDWSVHDLKIAKSTDGGDNWGMSDIKNVESAGDVGKYSSVAVNGNNVFIAYLDETNDLLKFARSTDGSDTWISGNIMAIAPGDKAGGELDMTTNGDTIYIAYETSDLDTYDFDLKFIRSMDGGVTWTDVASLDSSGYHPRIVVDANAVYVTYESGGIRFVKSVNDGASFEENDFRMIDEDSSGFCNCLAISGSTVFSCYSDLNESGFLVNDVLKILKSPDGGGTW